MEENNVEAEGTTTVLKEEIVNPINKVANMKSVKFYTHNGYLEGPVIKENKKTVWVQLTSGKVIKRHKSKHYVE